MNLRELQETFAKNEYKEIKVMNRVISSFEYYWQQGFEDGMDEADILLMNDVLQLLNELKFIKEFEYKKNYLRSED